MTKTYEEIVALVRDTLVDAGSTFRPDKKAAYKRAIQTERNEQAILLVSKWREAMSKYILPSRPHGRLIFMPLCPPFPQNIPSRTKTAHFVLKYY